MSGERDVTFTGEAADVVRAQHPPRAGAARPTAHMVVEDMLAKYDAGAVKYGTQHQHDNGRDHMVDAYQEILDAACYLRAEIEKRKRTTDTLDLHEQLSLARLDLAAARETSKGLEAATVELNDELRVAEPKIQELTRQLEVAAKRANEQTTRETELLSKLGVAEFDLKNVERMATHSVAVHMYETVCKDRDAAIAERNAKEVDLATWEAEALRAKRELAEAQHEVEASRKLSSEGPQRALVRRCTKILEIVDSGSPAWSDLPSVKEIRALAAGERDR